MRFINQPTTGEEDHHLGGFAKPRKKMCGGCNQVLQLSHHGISSAAMIWANYNISLT